MNEILCSTGALITRQNGLNYRLLPEIAPRLRCDGFEFMMSGSWTDTWEQISDEVQKMQLSFPAFHADKRVGELISRNEDGDNEQAARLFETNCRFAQRIGSTKMVLHLWGGIPSDKNIGNNIAQYKILREIAENYGLLLTVENVVCNTYAPLQHFEELKEVYPDISFTFDVRHAQFHDQLDAAFEGRYRELWNAICHVHISDYAGGYMEWGMLRSLHPGEGKIDFEKLFGDLGQVNYKDSFTVEATSVLPDGSIDFEKLNGTFDYLRGLMK